MKLVSIFSVFIFVLALITFGCNDGYVTAPYEDSASLRDLPRNNQGETQYEGAMVRMNDVANDFTYRWIMPNGNPHPWFSYIKTTPLENDPQTYYFYAGQHYKSGEVEVWKENNDLQIKIIMVNDWQLLEAKLNVRLTGFSGPPAFGRFPYKYDFSTPVEDEYTFSIPWNSDWNDEELNIAFHGEVKRIIAPPTARVQVIHNSADLAAEFVDVWLDDTKLIEDFEFRTATPFIDAPAGMEFTIAIQPPGSTGPEDPIWSQNYTLEADETYILVANGIVSPSGYDPVEPFDIYVYGMGREQATSGSNTDVLAFHGSTDAPTVSVWETGVGAGEIIPSLAYGDFAGYLELPTANYVLEVRDETGTTTVAAYEAPLQALGLNGAAITVVASGFLDPGNNNNGPAFGLWVALAAGGSLVELPLHVPPTARVQVIHNSADLAAEFVDVWLDDIKLIEDFEFRTATPFIDAPAGVEFTIAIQGPGSTGPENPIWSQNYTLAADETYILVANGIVSPSGYDPVEPFDIYVFGEGREQASNAGQTDVLAFHGSTDAPTVSVWETSVVDIEIIPSLMYGQFAGYLELPTLDYILEVRDETGTTTVAAYEAPLQTLGLNGAALTVVASGFLDPGNNSNGPAFGLWVALAAGGDLIPLPLVVNDGQVQSSVRFR